MKGIAHFLAGMAAATFIPGVVESAAQGAYLIMQGRFIGLPLGTLYFRARSLVIMGEGKSGMNRLEEETD